MDLSGNPFPLQSIQKLFVPSNKHQKSSLSLLEFRFSSVAWSDRPEEKLGLLWDILQANPTLMHLQDKDIAESAAVFGDQEENKLENPHFSTKEWWDHSTSPKAIHFQHLLGVRQSLPPRIHAEQVPIALWPLILQRVANHRVHSSELQASISFSILLGKALNAIIQEPKNVG